SYPSGHSAEVSVRCRGLVARFSVAIGDEPAPPRPDDTWRLQAPDGGNTGNAWVYRAPGRSEVLNPVILVEGFPGSHPCDYMYELLNQQGLLERLRAAGHDVVIVGLDQGMDVIQRNAPVLIECIREAVRRTPEPLVVGGVSMGGIVSRYALAQMESAGEEHRTHTFVSIDSPHDGTYTSLGVQWFVHALLPLAPALGGFAALIDSPSNQQLIKYWLHDGKVGASPLREQLLRDLAAVGGWPRKPRRIAVSCGRGDGAGDATVPGGNVLTWDGEPFVSVSVNTLPATGTGTVAEGSWFLGQLPTLVAGDGVAWDGAPGARGDYHGRISAIAAGFGCGSVRHAFDSTCSVPTVSALAVEQDPYEPVSAGSPFHDYACSSQNEPHLAIEPEMADWLLQQIGTPGG
ncbi:MAG: hypothetical protein QOC95_1798, partial [Thermoleophilaceae bacterium]|nr:hypothetical protein [Thermoleophilaceae bacterium]